MFSNLMDTARLRKDRKRKRIIISMSNTNVLKVRTCRDQERK